MVRGGEFTELLIEFLEIIHLDFLEMKIFT